MARTAHDLILTPTMTTDEQQEIEDRAVDLGALSSAEAHLRQLLEGGAAEALMIAGRIQAATVAAQMSDILIAQSYDRLKKTKCYRHLPYRDAAGKPATVATLEEFTQNFLGRSGRRCRELSANLATLGADLYEAAEAIGFRQRDYAALKALPADDQAAVKLALTGEDKDRAIEVLSDLVARQSQEKAALREHNRALEAGRAEVKADYDSLTTLYGEAKVRLQKLEAGDLAPKTLVAQMAAWPGACGQVIGEMRQLLVQIGLMIDTAEQLPLPEPDSPAWDAHGAGLRLLYDALSAPLAQFADEVQGTAVHLDRLIGALAYPSDPRDAVTGA